MRGVSCLRFLRGEFRTGVESRDKAGLELNLVDPAGVAGLRKYFVDCLFGFVNVSSVLTRFRAGEDEDLVKVGSTFSESLSERSEAW